MFGKTYKFASQENFDGFLKANGVPEEKIPHLINYAPDVKLEQNGDSYTYTTTSPDGNVKEVTFKSGQEIEDTIGAEKIPIKSTYVVDGNTVTQSIKAEKGNALFKREYNGDELVLTMTSDSWPGGVAKRIYKA